MLRLADRLSQDDLVDLHDLLLDGRARAGVDAAVVIEAGPSVVVDAAHGAGLGCWSLTCAFRVGPVPVAVVFACDPEHRGRDIEHELLRTAGKIQRRLAQAIQNGSGARGAA